jgi:hypothetical protein
MKKINIGISLFATPQANIWSSGINQNIAFLVQLFQRLPQVGAIYLLNGGDATDLPPMLEFHSLGVPLVAPESVTHAVDVVIEMGAKLPLNWLRHVRALGVKTVSFMAGHSYTSVAEAPMFKLEQSAIFNGAPFDAVWSLPQHMRSCAPLLETVLRAPVVEVPHLWAPTFLDRQIATVQTHEGKSFGFKPATASNRRAWNMAIFEPNISVVKSCFVPMLLCDAAYRLHPERLGIMRVFNSMHMKEHLTFNRLATNLDLTRHSQASFEPRLAFAEAMVSFDIDVVVSHQWECGLNYAYYDALYGGYPLVHNSDFLGAQGIGLYYPSFAAQKGAQVLVQAWQKGPDYWGDYAVQAHRFLGTLSPAHGSNLQAFSERLTQLSAEPSLAPAG